MKIERRVFLKWLTTAAAVITPVLADSRGANNMYGLIVKMTTASGERDGVIAILKDSARDMPGCLSYVIARDSADENVVWITEVWDSMASHEASLSLASVKNAISQAKSRITSVDRIAVTIPVTGVGLKSAQVP